MAESGAGWLLVGRQEGTRDDADDGLAGNLVYVLGSNIANYAVQSCLSFP